MNFDEAVRNFQMTPFPNLTTASFDLNYNMNLTQPNQSLHSRTNTISDGEFGIKIKAQQRMDKKEDEKECGTPQNESNMSNSDTYDDDMDTETEDYLSDEEEEEYDEKKDKDKALTKKSKLRVRSRTLSRPRTTNINFLRIPNESDDNFDDNMDDDMDDDGMNNVDLSIINNKHHIRSYSESNIQKTIQNNQWPSSASSEDSFDFDAGNDADSTVYSRYISMKKKYKKQRRISQQFQDAITVIQDENEDVMQQSEEHIRAQFEDEYEIKLIELEHEKLNNAMNIEDKMKIVLLKNDELMMQNKQLQQQVAAQVVMIQEQQQITLQQQRSFVAMHSGGVSPASSINTHSPLATLTQFPSAHALLRRVSSGSTINTVNTLSNMPSNITINAATNKNLGLGLNPMSSNGEVSYSFGDDFVSVDGDGDINMEPAIKYKKKKQKKYQISKRKKLKELEKRLLHNDDEVAKKIGSGQSPWDRFVDLMTPSFCSCSPNIPQQNQEKSN